MSSLGIGDFFYSRAKVEQSEEVDSAAEKKRREDEPAGEPGDEDEEGEVGDHHQEHPGPDAQEHGGDLWVRVALVLRPQNQVRSVDRRSVREEMLSRINYNLEAPQERERMLTQRDMIWVVLISPVLRTMTN